MHALDCSVICYLHLLSWFICNFLYFFSQSFLKYVTPRKIMKNMVLVFAVIILSSELCHNTCCVGESALMSCVEAPLDGWRKELYAYLQYGYPLVLGRRTSVPWCALDSCIAMQCHSTKAIDVLIICILFFSISFSLMRVLNVNCRDKYRPGKWAKTSVPISWNREECLTIPMLEITALVSVGNMLS